MEEVKDTAVSEQEQGIVENEQEQCAVENGENKPNAKQSIKNIWEKIKAFFAKHENLRQMVMFILFSLVCFAVEKILFVALKYGLEKECGATPIKWFIFDYTGAGNGLNGFVAFIVSQVVAQALTFLLNRKKTFKATNNIVIAGTLYAVFAVGIVLFNVYLGGVVPSAIAGSMGGSAGKAVGDIVGQALVSVSAFVISFVCNKLLAVINFGKKKPAADSAELVAEMACDTQDAEPTEATEE